jgi:predicted RNase H-like HicB family nuclease
VLPRIKSTKKPGFYPKPGFFVDCQNRKSGVCYNLPHKQLGSKEQTSMTYKATIIIEKDEHGYYAYAPELAGCQTQGSSLDEIMVNIQEAVELYVDTMTDDEIKQSLS